MKPVKLLFIIAFLCTTITQSHAVTLATWTFTNASGDWGPSPKDATSSNTNVTVGGLTRGSGLLTSGTAAGSAWGGAGFTDGIAIGSQTAATAVAQGNFITFTVTANAGFSLSMTQIAAYNIRRSSTGPGFMIWQYSLNGTNFTDIGTTITIGGTTTSSGNAKPAVALSGITDLQDVPSGTTVTFRAVAWAASSDAGTWYLNGNAGGTFSFTGDVNSTPLSLHLVSFKGRTENVANQLDWVTANEKNVSHFELQRGTDGVSFSKIAVLTAKGNDKTDDTRYNYTDNEPKATSYYRLLMADMNGTVTYSDIVVLHNEGKKQHMDVYPNPATTTLFVRGLNNVSSYSITDVTGRSVVPTTAINAESVVASIDISDLNPGVYLLQLINGVDKQALRFIKK